MKIDFEIRNNMWGKTENQLQTIETHRKILCPWNHVKSHFDVLDPTRKYSHIFIDAINIGSVIAVHDSNCADVLLVRVCSVLKREICPYYKIVIDKTKQCPTHPIIECDCVSCHNSIFTIPNVGEGLFQYMNEQYTFQNLYCWYRDIEILCRVPKTWFKTVPRLSIRRCAIELTYTMVPNGLVYPGNDSGKTDDESDDE